MRKGTTGKPSHQATYVAETRAELRVGGDGPAKLALEAEEAEPSCAGLRVDEAEPRCLKSRRAERERRLGGARWRKGEKGAWGSLERHCFFLCWVPMSDLEGYGSQSESLLSDMGVCFVGQYPFAG